MRAYVVPLVLGIIVVGGAVMFAASGDNERPKETSKVVTDCRLSVTAEQKSYSAGQPIDLTAVLENQNKAIVPFDNSTIMENYRFVVRLPNGELAPLTLEGQRQKKALRIGFDAASRLRSGKSYTAKISNLNRLYDMTLLTPT